MYALIRNNTIAQVGALPRVWNDGDRDWGLGVEGAVTPEQVTALGWHEVTLTPRPADTDTHTSVEGYEVVDGLPVQTWTPRPWTPEELAARQAAATQAALTDVTALDARLDRLAAYKTDTDLAAVLAQTNNQALPTATLNRALKTMIRREERLSATLALLVRLIDPALLADTSDTTDA